MRWLQVIVVGIFWTCLQRPNLPSSLPGTTSNVINAHSTNLNISLIPKLSFVNLQCGLHLGIIDVCVILGIGASVNSSRGLDLFGTLKRGLIVHVMHPSVPSGSIHNTYLYIKLTSSSQVLIYLTLEESLWHRSYECRHIPPNDAAHKVNLNPENPSILLF